MISNFGENSLANYKKEDNIGKCAVTQGRAPMASSTRLSISRPMSMWPSRRC